MKQTPSTSGDAIIDEEGNTDTLLELNEFRQLDRTIIFAPGEGNAPVCMLHDKNAEFLAFPSIFCG